MMPEFKFYKKNKLNDDCTYTFTSASVGTAVNLYDKNRATKVYSSGSNDATPEIWTIEFQAGISQPIDTIFVDNHNIKSGTVKYWNGTAYVNFSTPVVWSNNTEVTSCFSFNRVLTTKVQFTLNTTMTANAQKYAGQILILESIGKPETPPSAYSISWIDKGNQHTSISGGVVQILWGSKASIKLNFSDATYPDIDLFESLKRLGEPFVVYLNGGNYAGKDRGVRLRDIFTVNYMNDFSPVLKSNILEMNQSIIIDLKET